MAAKKAKTRKAKKKKYQIEMTSTSIFLWGFCVFFLIAWIFVLGILVGRGFLPGAVIHDLKGQLSKFQGMVGYKNPSEGPSESKVDPDPKLAFYERLASKKDEAKKDWQSEKPEQPPEPEPKPPEETVKDIPATGTVEKTGGPEGNPSRAAADKARFTVQVASLADRKKAEKMIEILRGQGVEAYTYEATVSGRTYYRIRCGRFLTREEAGAYAKTLVRDVGLKGFVSRLE